jgi:hypothetical protein
MRERDWVMAGGVSITAILMPMKLQPGQRLLQVGQSRLYEVWRGRLAGIPPMGEAALRVSVDQRDLAGTGPACLHGKVTRQGGLAGPALLGCSDDDVHADAPTMWHQHQPAPVSRL